MNLTLKTLPLCGIAVTIATSGLAPAWAQNNPRPRIEEPEAANAPIPDREVARQAPATFKLRSQAPDLAQIGIVKTNYPIPKGAFFVAVSGNANSPGTDRKRPTTLARAIQNAPAGATVVLAGGTYRDIEELKVERQITLQPAPGEQVWIKGSDVVSDFTPDGGRFSAPWNKKFTYTNALDMDKNFPMAMETDMVFLGGRALQQVATPAEVGPGTFCVDVERKKLVLGDDPRGKMVEATARSRALSAQSPVLPGSQIRGLGFAHYADRAVGWIGQGTTFENNTFAWNAINGMTLNGKGHVMRGNTFACNGLAGMSGVFTDGLLFERNRVVFNNLEGFRQVWSAAGTKFIVSKDMLFRNNVYDANNSMGLWLDITCQRVNVVGNTVSRSNSIGIYYECCHAGFVAFNTCTDNGAGIMLSDGTSTAIWNNTLIDNAKGIIIKDTPRINNEAPTGFYKTAAADFAGGATWIARDARIHNNLLIGGRNAKSVLFDASVPLKDEVSRDMISSISHNAFQRQTPDSPPVLVKWKADKMVDYADLGEFNAQNSGLVSGPTLLLPAQSANMAPAKSLTDGAPIPAEIRAAALAAGLKLPNGKNPIGATGKL